MKKLFKLLIPSLFLICSNQLYAQKTYIGKLEGTLVSNGVTLGDCVINSITVGYKLGTLVGEPTIYLNVKWNGQDPKCFTNKRFFVFLSIGIGGYDYYVNAGGSADMIVPSGNGEWGLNPLAGSPNWNKVITKNTSGNANNLIYITGDEAKKLWRNGFTVHGGKLITSTGNIIYF